MIQFSLRVRKKQVSWNDKKRVVGGARHIKIGQKFFCGFKDWKKSYCSVTHWSRWREADRIAEFGGWRNCLAKSTRLPITYLEVSPSQKGEPTWRILEGGASLNPAQERHP
jgi:hypothetical protein